MFLELLESCVQFFGSPKACRVGGTPCLLAQLLPSRMPRRACLQGDTPKRLAPLHWSGLLVVVFGGVAGTSRRPRDLIGFDPMRASEAPNGCSKDLTASVLRNPNKTRSWLVLNDFTTAKFSAESADEEISALVSSCWCLPHGLKYDSHDCCKTG